jgi:hypothetical protein
MNPSTDTRRIRRLEAHLSSVSSEGDKALQNLEKAVAELTLRVACLESNHRPAAFADEFDVTTAKF